MENVSSTWINGALVYHEREKLWRFLDAVGDNVFKYEMKPGVPVDDTTGDPVQFTVTTVEGTPGEGTIVNAVTAGSLLTLTTANEDYAGFNIQLKGEGFKLATGKPLYFGAKITCAVAALSSLLVGLCETDTTLMATASAHAVAVSGDGAFFAKLAGASTVTITAEMYKDGAQTATANAATEMDTDEHFYEIYWDGVSTVSYYLDGVLVTSVAADLADGDLTPSLNVRAGTTAATVFTVNKLLVIQIR